MLDRILPLLDQLSAEELSKLSQRLKALASVSAAVPAVANEESQPDADFVVSCAAEALAGIGAEYPVRFQLQQACKSNAFREKLPGLMRFFRAAHPQRAGQRALLVMAFGLLYEDMQERGYVCTVNTLIAHAHRLPAVLNRHFPGYAQAGMLHWIVKGR